ncbi:protein ALP1-like [Alosa sapidissima]|uniref:protein ALP1-like n=1 Tax=Alosa sapidissima TaxID=34773 RepID=UPI001C0973CA|nr:protein ALP1-like [Alosa sapidissima]
MYTNACVASAGRAVLEMMQYDWEPLSHGELDQRLDQAVEEILEAQLMAVIQHPSPVLLQLSRSEEPLLHLQAQSQDVVHPQVVFQLTDSLAISSNADVELQRQSAEKAEENPAVQHIMDLLKNANTSYNRSRLAGRARLSLSHTVLLSLTLLSKRRSYRSVSTSFRLEKGNIHRIFFSFCDRVNALEEQQIRWPKSQEMMDSLLPFSSLLGVNDVELGIPKVLGVLGHTRIPIRLPIGKQDVEKEELDLKHLTKDVHPDSWLNLEFVCDRQGRFIHCRVSRGSEHDRASDLRRRIQSNRGMVPPGCCLVAGTGYPLTDQILTPYSAGHGPRENLFNKTLESHLCRLDQAVEDLKARFQRLKYLDMGNYDRAKAVVLTACILHNVFLDMGDIVKGQSGKEMGEQEQDGDREEAGLRWRDTVAQQLYSALDTENF